MNNMFCWHGTYLENMLKAGCTEIISGPEHCYNKYQLPGYEWLAAQTGFYPIFMSIGDERAIGHCGYKFNWQRKVQVGWTNDGKPVYHHVKKGESPNMVLFAFKINLIDMGVFTSYPDPWHQILSLTYSETGVPTADMIKQLLRPEMSKVDWLALAQENPMALQLVVPKLDLRKAEFVYVRNETTRKQLSTLGFSNVETKRIPVKP